MRSTTSRADEDIRTIDAQIADIETKAQVEIDAQANSCDASSTLLQTKVLTPKKSALSLRSVVLA